ncbi:MAG TPA: hypothetical protein VNO21_23675 [Polyangiaceae bacterium]|nr:hypothetical protein [Polyangiaceae bacterium]
MGRRRRLGGANRPLKAHEPREDLRPHTDGLIENPQELTRAEAKPMRQRVDTHRRLFAHEPRGQPSHLGGGWLGRVLAAHARLERIFDVTEPRAHRRRLEQPVAKARTVAAPEFFEPQVLVHHLVQRRIEKRIRATRTKAHGNAPAHVRDGLAPDVRARTGRIHSAFVGAMTRALLANMKNETGPAIGQQHPLARAGRVLRHGNRFHEPRKASAHGGSLDALGTGHDRFFQSPARARS